MARFNRKQKFSNKQIVKDVRQITHDRGWDFREIGSHTIMVDRPKTGGKGKRTIIKMRCKASGKTMEVHVDRFKEGKIRFTGIDPFKDQGPLPCLASAGQELAAQEARRAAAEAAGTDPNQQVNIDDLTDEQKAKLGEMIAANDRDGVVAYLQELGKMPEILPPPSAEAMPGAEAAAAAEDLSGIDIDAEMPEIGDVLAVAKQAADEIKAGGNEEEILGKAVASLGGDASLLDMDANESIEGMVQKVPNKTINPPYTDEKLKKALDEEAEQ